MVGTGGGRLLGTAGGLPMGADGGEAIATGKEGGCRDAASVGASGFGAARVVPTFIATSAGSSTVTPAAVTKLIQPSAKRTRIVPWAFSLSSIAKITAFFSSVPTVSLSVSKPARTIARRLQT